MDIRRPGPAGRVIDLRYNSEVMITDKWLKENGFEFDYELSDSETVFRFKDTDFQLCLYGAYDPGKPYITGWQGFAKDAYDYAYEVEVWSNQQVSEAITQWLINKTS